MKQTLGNLMSATQLILETKWCYQSLPNMLYMY